MGVRGLTTYISDNSKIYLKDHKLCDCYLVVDGNNIASHTYLWMTNSDSAFGGDYDEYYKIVRGFFEMLLKCRVTPIVLFDGGYERKKLKTIFSRAIQKLPLLRNFNEGYSKSKFFPLFMKQTFFDVMKDLEIFCVQCDLEADIEIAAVARALNCPVLSYDSDFYIFDVLYIPFSSVCLSVSQNHDKSYYVNCSIYDVTNFMMGFTGLDKSHLPILATLLGNDYIDSSIFQNFFNHLIISKNKYKSYTQRRIHGVVHWLKKETVESATKLILSHVGNKYAEKVMHAINMSIQDYTKIDVSEAVITGVARLISKKIGDVNLCKKHFPIRLPSQVIGHFQECRLHKVIVDMVILQTYFTQQQLEELHVQSSHLPCLQVIRAIYTILNPYMENKSLPLKLYLNVKNHYAAMKLEKDLSQYSLGDILSQPKEARLKVMYDILGVVEDDIEFLANNDAWKIFIISYVYWMNKLNHLVSFAHIHALILMAVSNQIVQKKVGYYKNFSKFNKSKGHLLEKLKDTQLTVKESKNFSELLTNVTTYECLIAQSVLIPFRQTMEMGMGKGYSISIVHLFNSFQSCIFHIMQLNALLNYPLPHLQISDFYSGTLLFNFYLSVKSKGGFGKFGQTLFKDTPNLANIYNYLCENLCKFSTKTQVENIKPKKKKRNKSRRKSEESACEIVPYDQGDENEYVDENNPYFLLDQIGIRLDF